MLWHNVNQRHPPSLTMWSHCMTKTSTWHFHFHFLFWPTVLLSTVTQWLALTPPHNNFYSKAQYMRQANVKLQGVSNPKKQTNLRLGRHSKLMSGLTVPPWLFVANELDVTSQKCLEEVKAILCARSVWGQGWGNQGVNKTPVNHEHRQKSEFKRFRGSVSRSCF